MKFARETACRLNKALMKSSTYLYDAAPSLYESVHRHLKTCAFMAIVAVACFALAQPSEAKVVYTPANVVIQSSYNLDVNNDGITDFTIQNIGKFTNRCNEYAYVDELPASGNGVVPYEVNGAWAAALSQGAQIGPGQQFWESSGLTMTSFSLHCPFESFEGPWLDVVNHYLGLSFQVNGQTHYGWARLSVLLHCGRGGGCAFVVTLTGYAYETIPGKSINAGQTSGAQDDPILNPEDSSRGASLNNPVHDTPQTASLSMLPFGTQSVPLSRRKEVALEGS